MANPFFQFKQFTIYHDQCAMKVGTDGVLLGAWTDIKSAQHALDIGCGSGLITIMLAQRNPLLQIDAIDTDKGAIEQTETNAMASPFSSRITPILISLQDFSPNEDRKYELIVSNPPFFSQSLKSPDDQRTTARHTDSLSLDALIGISTTLLDTQGRLALVYPHSEKENILAIAKQHRLHACRICNVFPTPSSNAKRILVELSPSEQVCIETDLVIEESRHVYTPLFTQLLKDFYLKM